MSITRRPCPVNRARQWWMVTLCASLITSCATTARAPVHRAGAPATTPLAMSGVGVEPKTIDVDKQEIATIRYTLSRAADVTIDLVDEDGHLVRRLKVGSQPAGVQRIPWDGHDTAGQRVCGGVYRYLIHAQDADGHHDTYDPSTETGGEELTPRAFTFDHPTRTFRWIMPKAGRARLRIGLQGFPHLRTLLDWQPLEAGKQELVWDGTDASGFIQLMEHPSLSMKLSAYSLPDNTLIVRSVSPTTAATIPQPAAYPANMKGQPAYLHARHQRSACHEVRLRVEFPSLTTRDPQGRPLLEGIVPVRVIIDEHDLDNVTNQRYEVGLYEDLTFLFEEEEGVTPWTFLWDTTRLPAGPHLLTVNVLSYDDHDGVVTQPVAVAEHTMQQPQLSARH